MPAEKMKYICLENCCRKEPNLGTLLSSSLHLYVLAVLVFSFCSYTGVQNFSTCFGAFNKLALISNDSTDKGKVCSWVVQFLKIGTPRDSITFCQSSSQKPLLL